MSTTLLLEVCKNLERILGGLQAILDSDKLILEPNHDNLVQILTEISAHHLAKEDTLFKTLNISCSKNIGEARIFHLVIDDLTHIIISGGYHGETMGSHIRLLKLLLQSHFLSVELMLLGAVSNMASKEKQAELGKLYRENYRKYCTQVCQKSEITLRL